MGKFFSALGKYILVILTLGTYKVDRAANEKFTNSVDGINAGFTEARDNLAKQCKELVTGIGGLETLKLEKEAMLQKLEDEEQNIENTIEGILTVLDKNPNDQEAINDYTTLTARQQEIDDKQEELDQEISGLADRLSDYDLQLKKYQDQIYKLKQEQKEAVADHTLAKMEKELLEKENGLKQSVDMSGVEAIRNRRKQHRAEINTLRRASGADTQKRLDKYNVAGQQSKAGEDLKAILAARAAKDKASETGSVQQATPLKQSERKV